MKNFIPTDFFEKDDNTVYASKEMCIQVHGSAVGFDPRTVDISVSKMRGGKVVVDPGRETARAVAIAAGAFVEKRRIDYEKEGLNFNRFVELLIEEDVEAMAEYRSKRNIIRSRHPGS